MFCSFFLLLHQRRKKEPKKKKTAIAIFVADGADLTKLICVPFAKKQTKSFSAAKDNAAQYFYFEASVHKLKSEVQ